MSGAKKHKLSDAVPQPESAGTSAHGGKPKTTSSTKAEQTREAQESQKAKNAEASIRDKMVDIGRGNQQSGRQGK